MSYKFYMLWKNFYGVANWSGPHTEISDAKASVPNDARASMIATPLAAMTPGEKRAALPILDGTPGGATPTTTGEGGCPVRDPHLFFLSIAPRSVPSRELPHGWRGLEADPAFAVEIASGVRIAPLGTGDFMLPGGTVGRGAGIAVWTESPDIGPTAQEQP